MYKQGLFLLLFNKEVICVMDKGAVEPLCKTQTGTNEVRDAIDKVIPINDPYIPRSNVKLFNCSKEECISTKLSCISQVTSPTLNLQSCYLAAPEKYECEKIRYNYFKNIDKLLFLSKNILDKIFYMVDCLVYEKGDRICHIKDSADSHANLLDTGNIARPNETAVLSQDEFVCQQSAEDVLCDLNPFIPLASGLELKKNPTIAQEILLKTGTYFVPLKLKCFEDWCGYTGRILKTRRVDGYKPPGGDIYRCFYANRQQICKKISSIYEEKKIFL